MRIAIISDIHEDITSLKVAFRKIEKLNIDEVACLGDISGFSIPHYSYQKTRNAHECLSLIRSNCKTVVLGNHDIHAAGIIPENSPNFDFPENWYQMDYHHRQQLANNSVWLHEENDLDPLYKEDDREYLRTLPEYAVMETPEGKILFSHYIYPNLSGFHKSFYSYRDEFHKHFNYMKALECKLSFTGHSHVKGFYTATMNRFKQFRNKKTVLNHKPVCIGIPPITTQIKRNGFCIFDTANSLIRIINLQ